MKFFKLIFLLAIVMFQASCGKGENSTAPTSSQVFQGPSKWERSFKEDPFDDKKKTLNFVNRSEQGVGALLLMCEDNVPKFFWQYADSGKAPFAGMDMEVILRLDNEPTFNEQWGWAASQPLMYPKGNKIQFLNKLVGKQKFALKSVLADATYGVFDITGFDKAFGEIKEMCGNNQPPSN